MSPEVNNNERRMFLWVSILVSAGLLPGCMPNNSESEANSPLVTEVEGCEAPTSEEALEDWRKSLKSGSVFINPDLTIHPDPVFLDDQSNWCLNTAETESRKKINFGSEKLERKEIIGLVPGPGGQEQVGMAVVPTRGGAIEYHRLIMIETDFMRNTYRNHRYYVIDLDADRFDRRSILPQHITPLQTTNESGLDLWERYLKELNNHEYTWLAIAKNLKGKNLVCGQEKPDQIIFDTFDPNFGGVEYEKIKQFFNGGISFPQIEGIKRPFTIPKNISATGLEILLHPSVPTTNQAIIKPVIVAVNKDGIDLRKPDSDVEAYSQLICEKIEKLLNEDQQPIGPISQVYNPQSEKQKKILEENRIVIHNGKNYIIMGSPESFAESVGCKTIIQNENRQQLFVCLPLDQVSFYNSSNGENSLGFSVEAMKAVVNDGREYFNTCKNMLAGRTTSMQIAWVMHQLFEIGLSLDELKSQRQKFNETRLSLSLIFGGWKRALLGA